MCKQARIAYYIAVCHSKNQNNLLGANGLCEKFFAGNAALCKFSFVNDAAIANYGCL